MRVIYADNYSPLSHSHVDASKNYKFTHCIFENVVNYLYFLFLPLFYSPMPTEKKQNQNSPIYIKHERTSNSYSAVRSVIHH